MLAGIDIDNGSCDHDHAF